ncbi:MAG: hypothetical protein AAF215_16240 [Cyanobacteria bacterium P01_A01_bin.123]
MSFFRAYIAPLFIILIFAIAMLAVSARIFLPSDMMAPAPVATAGVSLDLPWSNGMVLSGGFTRTDLS